MKLSLLLLIVCFSFTSYAQQDETEKIVAEGKELYHLEMASWYGTDIFLERFKLQLQNSAGYFSYRNNELTTCVFFSKGEQPKVLASFSFDSTYSISTAIVNSELRSFTELENNLYQIRRNALKIINEDTLFKTYEGANLNLIPLINGDVKKVFVLTGPQKTGVVIFGNDYLLNFDKDNNLISKRQLHKNIIPIEYGKEDVVGTMHSHLPETGEFITSTDICTLMLYAKSAKWKQHYVISEKYINIWDCEKNMLAAITHEAWEKINTDQKKRRGKN